MRQGRSRATSGTPRLPLCPAEGLDRIIAWLPQDGLAAVCAARGHPGLHREPRPVVKAVLLAWGLTLRPLLELLPRPLLLEVPALIGLPWLDWTDSTIVAAVLGQLGPRVAPPAPLEAWQLEWLEWFGRRRGPWDLPATVAEASRRAVGCVRPGGLRELCDALGAPHLLRPTAEATREAIVAEGFDLAWLFESLPERVVSRLPRALGLGGLDRDVPEVEVALRALALVEEGLALIRVLEPILGSLSEPVRRHLARDLGATRVADGSARSIAAALARGHTLDELLDAMTSAERRRAGRACGVEGDEAALRDALYELARPPEPRQHPPRVPEAGLSWLVLTGVLRSLRFPTLQRLAQAFGVPTRHDPDGALRELEPPLEELVALLDVAELRDVWDEVSELAREPRPGDDASAADLRAWLVALVDPEPER